MGKTSVLSDGLQGLEPLLHPFRGGGGSDCGWIGSARKPQQGPKAGAGFLGRVAARVWSFPKKKHVSSIKARGLMLRKMRAAWLPPALSF